MILLNGAHVVNAKREKIFTISIGEKKTFEVMDMLEDAGLYYEIFTAEHVYSSNQPIRIEFFSEHILGKVPGMSKKWRLQLLHAIYP